MSDYTRKQIEPVAHRLRGIAEEFTREVGRKPSAEELFEILTWGLTSCIGASFADVKPKDIKALTPEFKKGHAPPAQPESVENVVHTLNDEPFNAATDLFHHLIGDLKRQTGKPPTLAQALDLLADAFRECKDCVADHRPEELSRIKPELETKKKIRYRIGDIVAIPAAGGKYYLAIILAENRIGVAFGLFQGASKLRPISRESYPPIEPRPIYSDASAIESGRRRIIGHDEELLSLFPRDPEIYHYSHPDMPNPAVDPYGAAETASGKLRKLTKKEADEVGLTSLEYRQSYFPDELEKYLKKKWPVS